MASRVLIKVEIHVIWAISHCILQGHFSYKELNNVEMVILYGEINNTAVVTAKVVNLVIRCVFAVTLWIFLVSFRLLDYACILKDWERYFCLEFISSLC